MLCSAARRRSSPPDAAADTLYPPAADHRTPERILLASFLYPGDPRGPRRLPRPPDKAVREKAAAAPLAAISLFDKILNAPELSDGAAWPLMAGICDALSPGTGPYPVSDLASGAAISGRSPAETESGSGPGAETAGESGPRTWDLPRFLRHALATRPALKAHGRMFARCLLALFPCMDRAEEDACLSAVLQMAAHPDPPHPDPPHPDPLTLPESREYPDRDTDARGCLPVRAAAADLLLRLWTRRKAEERPSWMPFLAARFSVDPHNAVRRALLHRLPEWAEREPERAGDIFQLALHGREAELAPAAAPYLLHLHRTAPDRFRDRLASWSLEARAGAVPLEYVTRWGVRLYRAVVEEGVPSADLDRDIRLLERDELFLDLAGRFLDPLRRPDGEASEEVREIRRRCLRGLAVMAVRAGGAGLRRRAVMPVFPLISADLIDFGVEIAYNLIQAMPADMPGGRGDPPRSSDLSDSPGPAGTPGGTEGPILDWMAVIADAAPYAAGQLSRDLLVRLERRPDHPDTRAAIGPLLQLLTRLEAGAASRPSHSAHLNETQFLHRARCLAAW